MRVQFQGGPLDGEEWEVADEPPGEYYAAEGTLNLNATTDASAGQPSVLRSRYVFDPDQRT